MYEYRSEAFLGCVFDCHRSSSPFNLEYLTMDSVHCCLILKIYWIGLCLIGTGFNDPRIR